MISWIEFATPQVCNFNCVYCYNRPPYRDNGVLPLDVFSSVLDDVGPEFVSILGGEPSLYHSILVKYLSECKKRNIETRVATNSAHLTEDMIREMRSCGLSRIWISWNAPKHIFSDFRRPCHADDYDNVKKRITFSSKLGLTVDCDAVLTKYNFKYLPQLYKEASSMGASTFTLQTLVPSGNGTSPELLLNKEEYVEAVTSVYPFINDNTKLLLQCNWIAQRCTQLGERIYNAPNTPESVRNGVECSEGFKRVHVHNNGDVLLCDIVDFPILGNVYKQPLSSILSENDFLKGSFVPPNRCSGCEKWNCCHNVCRGIVYMKTGSLTRQCADV